MENIPQSQDDPRASILESAYIQFTRYGFRKATVEDIARGAGLKKPSVYYYFKSKNEIIRAGIPDNANARNGAANRADEQRPDC